MKKILIALGLITVGVTGLIYINKNDVKIEFNDNKISIENKEVFDEEYKKYLVNSLLMEESVWTLF